MHNPILNYILQFEIQTAPWLMFFKAHGPEEKPMAPKAFSFSKIMDIPNMIDFINESLKIKIRLEKARTPQQIAWMVGSGMTTVLLLILLLNGDLNWLIFSRYVWMITSLVLNGGDIAYS